jgi:hypothetical protein
MAELAGVKRPLGDGDDGVNGETKRGGSPLSSDLDRFGVRLGAGVLYEQTPVMLGRC